MVFKKGDTTNKGRKCSEEFRDMRRRLMLGKKMSEETKRKKSQIMKNLWKNQDYVQKVKVGLANPEVERKRVEKIKKTMSTPEFQKKISQIRKGRHNSRKTEFRKGLIPWNKNLKGVMPTPWNKNKKGLQTAWNKNTKGLFHHNEEAKIKIKERRATQIFPVKDSKPEVLIQNVLKNLNVKFIPHKYIKEIEHSYQVDILIPSHKIIIEVDGDYWHGNQENPRYINLNDYQKKKIELDKIRTKELIDKGYKVLRFWESEILKDILKCVDKIEEVLKSKEV